MRAVPCSVRIDGLLCRAPILACYRTRHLKRRQNDPAQQGKSFVAHPDAIFFLRICLTGGFSIVIELTLSGPLN
jgi:hypothetical protein